MDYSTTIAEQQEVYASDSTADGSLLFTNQILSIATTFYIRAMFTGNYETGCGLTFKILDTSIIYRLHLNVDGNDKKVVQTSFWDGKWAPMKLAELPDLLRQNDIVVLVTNKHFEVTINDIMITRKFPIDLKRLDNYRGAKINYSGKCIRADLKNSYMTNGGNISI